MKTTYEWLLHNVGNEANYLTILNVKHQTDEVGTDKIDVMARTKEFKVVNLFISPTDTANRASGTSDETEGDPNEDSYLFDNEQSVIAYLSDGQTNTADTTESGIRVVLRVPADDAGEIIFPPKQ